MAEKEVSVHTANHPLYTPQCSPVVVYIFLTATANCTKCVHAVAHAADGGARCCDDGVCVCGRRRRCCSVPIAFYNRSHLKREKLTGSIKLMPILLEMRNIKNTDRNILVSGWLVSSFKQQIGTIMNHK